MKASIISEVESLTSKFFWFDFWSFFSCLSVKLSLFLRALYEAEIFLTSLVSIFVFFSRCESKFLDFGTCGCDQNRRWTVVLNARSATVWVEKGSSGFWLFLNIRFVLQIKWDWSIPATGGKAHTFFLVYCKFKNAFKWLQLKKILIPSLFHLFRIKFLWNQKLSELQFKKDIRIRQRVATAEFWWQNAWRFNHL